MITLTEQRAQSYATTVGAAHQATTRAVRAARAHQATYAAQCARDGFTTLIRWRERRLLVRPGTCLMRDFVAADLDQCCLVKLDGRDDREGV